jgi:hypothetical protein
LKPPGLDGISTDLRQAEFVDLIRAIVAGEGTDIIALTGMAEHPWMFWTQERGDNL